MARRTFVFRSTALTAAIVGSLALSQAAAASCITLPPLDVALAAAPVAFVGTVVETKHDGRTATFEVEEVWKGSVGARVVVNGGPEIDAITSVDRAYETGVRYLVVPAGARGNVMTDNACSSTQPYTAALASRAPSGAAPPADGGNVSASSGLTATASREGGVQPWLIVLVVLGTATVVVLTFTIARRGRRPRPSS
jgi:hypothetical protein